MYEEDFLMQLATVHVQNSRIGTCPHGLPVGACPICNGMGGGGGARKADFSAKPGEMSWNQCAAIGAFLKAQKAAQQANNQNYENFVQNMVKFQNTMASAHQRVSQMMAQIANSMPAIIAKPVNFILNTVVLNTLNALKNFPAAVINFAQNIAQKLTDIADKLTAVYGEIKAAIEKKISEAFKDLKKKVKSLFSIFQPLDAENEDKQIDETKRTFELKMFLHDLYKKLTGEEMPQESE